MREIGADVPESRYVGNMEEALAAVEELGFPIIIRPSFTLGGVGGGIAYNIEEFRELASRGIDLSPVHEVLLEESVIGWKEFELEVMRDCADNFVVICSIENVDPMGVHTGDSITVAPALTLTDKEYQRMRDLARRIIRRVGVETGGSNIQFAINPENGRIIVIEMNPRVSRSSALASKATGFPIAKIAAKLALGYHLDEIPNDITRLTPASFEPTIDYVVVKVPRWTFEKFPRADRTLTTQMKSVGEVMAIGRTFKEAFMKAFASLELGASGLLFGDNTERTHIGPDGGGRGRRAPARAERAERSPHVGGVPRLRARLDRRRSPRADADRSLVPRPVLAARRAAAIGQPRRPARHLARHAAHAQAIGIQRPRARADSRRRRRGGARRTRRARAEGRPTSGSIPARRNSSHSRRTSTAPTRQECEADPTPRQKVVILGSGPNRIGQGIEFDYCCCHAAFALREEGFETVMVNCNPETVSTDYDTVDRLYFEPLTFEDVSAIIAREQEAGGDVSCVVQYGGQTPLKLALSLQEAGIKIIGTSPDSIDLAEDRERFAQLLWDLGIPQAPSGTAMTPEEARDVAEKIGFPLVVRPSYVLGGRAMAIVYDMAALDRYMIAAVSVSPGHPILIDKFLEDAVELDVDAVADATGAVVIGGIMEHIEEAGIHSGDSSCVIPPYKVIDRHVATIRDYTRRIARALKVVGLMNTQFAIKDDVIYVLEVNPRASRTVPYLSKATGVPLAKVAARVMIGRTLEQLGLTEDLEVSGFFVKTPVFPFVRFPGVDTILGPEMKSTGEVMGGASTFGTAFAKAQIGAGMQLPTRRDRVHQRQQSRQAGRGADRARPARPRLPPGGDARNRELPARPRPQRRHRLQGQRGPPARRRRDSQRQDPDGHQHAARPRVVLRRPHRAADRDDARRAVHHDPHRCRCHRQRDQGAPIRGAHRPCAAGIPRRNCHAKGVAGARMLPRASNRQDQSR